MCGAQIADGVTACPDCGTPVSAAPVPSSQTASVPAPVEPVPATPAPATPVPAPVPAPMTPPPAPAPVLGSPLAMRSGALFLSAVICVCVMALFQLISMFTTMGDVNAISADLRGMPDEAEAMLSGMRVGMILGFLGAVAITAVVLVGLWMVYASGVGGSKVTVLTRGLKLLRGGVLAQMIVMIAEMAMLAVFLLSTLIAGMMGIIMGIGTVGIDFGRMDEEFLIVIGLVVAVLGLLVIVVGLGIAETIFYVKVRTALGHALTAAETGKVTGVPGMYVPVMCFVLAGLNILLVLVGILSGLLPILNALVESAAYILFGIVALQYRGRAKALSR